MNKSTAHPRSAVGLDEEAGISSCCGVGRGGFQPIESWYSRAIDSRSSVMPFRGSSLAGGCPKGRPGDSPTTMFAPSRTLEACRMQGMSLPNTWRIRLWRDHDPSPSPQPEIRQSPVSSCSLLRTGTCQGILQHGKSRTVMRQESRVLPIRCEAGTFNPDHVEFRFDWPGCGDLASGHVRTLRPSPVRVWGRALEVPRREHDWRRDESLDPVPPRPV
jgi:hypothetical protein